MKALIRFLISLSIYVQAVAAAEEASIKDCPRIGYEFKAAPYLRLAEDLQKSGQVAAIGKLREWAETGKYEDQIIVLCRMLFVSAGDEKFRSPGLGVPSFFGKTSYGDWPLVPVALHKSVPILITYGYSLFGRAEPSSSYVEYCSKECRWSKTQFRSLEAASIKSIVDSWIASKELSARERIFITRQAEQGVPAKPDRSGG